MSLTFVATENERLIDMVGADIFVIILILCGFGLVFWGFVLFADLDDRAFFVLPLGGLILLVGFYGVASFEGLSSTPITPTDQNHNCIVETDYNYCPNCGFELKGEIE